jgi:hypothetical protein
VRPSETPFEAHQRELLAARGRERQNFEIHGPATTTPQTPEASPPAPLPPQIHLPQFPPPAQPATPWRTPVEQREHEILAARGREQRQHFEFQGPEDSREIPETPSTPPPPPLAPPTPLPAPIQQPSEELREILAAQDQTNAILERIADALDTRPVHLQPTY